MSHGCDVNCDSSGDNPWKCRLNTFIKIRMSIGQSTIKLNIIMTSFVVGRLHLNLFKTFFFVAVLDFELDGCSLIRHKSFYRKHVKNTQFEKDESAL